MSPPWTTDTPWTSAHVRLVPDLCSKVMPKKKKCKELKSQAQIKSRLFAAVQHLEKYTIMRIKLLLWLLFQWSKPLYLCCCNLIHIISCCVNCLKLDLWGVFLFGFFFFGVIVPQEKGQAWAVSRIIPPPLPPLPQVRRKEAILRAAPACRGAEVLCCQQTNGTHERNKKIGTWYSQQTKATDWQFGLKVNFMLS